MSISTSLIQLLMIIEKIIFIMLPKSFSHTVLHYWVWELLKGFLQTLKIHRARKLSVSSAHTASNKMTNIYDKSKRIFMLKVLCLLLSHFLHYPFLKANAQNQLCIYIKK